MFMGKERFIPILALIIMIIGSTSSIYVYALQSNSENINVYNQEYTIDQIFYISEKRSFNEIEYSGVALDDLIIKAGVGCPSCHEYIITGSDGYQKTVTWENMQNGLLTYEKMTVFNDLPKAYRIKNVIKIEVS